MTIVKVATANPVKVEAIQTAFRHCFDEVKIISEEVNSGVPEQPTNELIFQGAENRINSIKKDNYDYLVSCEGGLIHQVGRWFNMQVVMIENRE